MEPSRQQEFSQAPFFHETLLQDSCLLQAYRPAACTWWSGACLQPSSKSRAVWSINGWFSFLQLRLVEWVAWRAVLESLFPKQVNPLTHHSFSYWGCRISIETCTNIGYFTSIQKLLEHLQTFTFVRFKHTKVFFSPNHDRSTWFYLPTWHSQFRPRFRFLWTREVRESLAFDNSCLLYDGKIHGQTNKGIIDISTRVQRLGNSHLHLKDSFTQLVEDTRLHQSFLYRHGHGFNGITSVRGDKLRHNKTWWWKTRSTHRARRQHTHHTGRKVDGNFSQTRTYYSRTEHN